MRLRLYFYFELAEEESQKEDWKFAFGYVCIWYTQHFDMNLKKRIEREIIRVLVQYKVEKNLKKRIESA